MSMRHGQSWRQGIVARRNGAKFLYDNLGSHIYCSFTHYSKRVAANGDDANMAVEIFLVREHYFTTRKLHSAT